MAGEFRFLDDVALADAAFEAVGDTPSELVQAAARALFETMADPATIAPVQRRTVEREADSLGDLLFDWLSDIVYFKDAEGLLFREADATVEQTEGARTWRLRAVLTGEPIMPARQELRADVKAVTKHLYEVRHDGARWYARVVLDI
ncbi:archease [Nitrospira sp. Kam-Ns4a]